MIFSDNKAFKNILAKLLGYVLTIGKIRLILIVAGNFEMYMKKMKETISDNRVLKRLRGLRLNENNENKCSGFNR